MNKLLTLCLIVTICFGCSPKKQEDTTNPVRIVSMAPSITEVIFALGEGDKVVAVTSYCDYPEKVKEIPKIGGLFDSSVEAIYSTKPNLVIHLPSQAKTASSLNNMGIDTLCISQEHVKDINSSITIIGDKLGCPDKAEALLNSLTITKFKSLKQPKVLIVISRDLTSNAVDDSYLAGSKTWYNDLLEKCGVVNAFSGKIPYPSFSLEGAMIMNPDIIIELIPEADQRNFSLDRLKSIWKNSLPEVNAVKNGRIHIIKDTFAVRPGPRYPLLFNRFKEIIHGSNQ